MASEEESRRSRPRELALNGAHLLGLSGLAFAQPIYDLLRGDLSSLVATDATGLALVLLVALIALGPPLVLLAVEALAFAIGRRPGRAVHLVFVGGLVGLFVLQAHASVDVPDPVVVALAAVLGVAAAVFYRRFAPMRLGLTVLAPAPLLFAALFLASPAVAPLLSPDEPRVEPASGRPAATVVLIVFDELPLASLLDRHARIDRARYPAFARLADDGTWFPNTTSVDGATPWAVPAILTGDRPDSQVLATAEGHPRSIFTLLGGDHETHAIEPITRICPQAQCRRDLAGDAARALRAANLLTSPSAHRLLPGVLGRGALKVTRRVQAAVGADTSGDYLAAQVRVRREDFRRFAASIRAGGRPGLHVLHVLLPHGPWELMPSGRRYSADLPGLVDGRWTRDRDLVAQAWQRHLLQLEYTDRLLGSVLRRLDREGLYDDALVAVAADHGVNFAPGQWRRKVDRRSVLQLAPVPFILKAPRQRRGRVAPQPLTTVDVLATIADALRVPLPWPTDGSSAFDPGRPRPETVTMTEAGADQVSVSRARLRRAGPVLARKLALFGSGRDRRRLFSLGEWAGLVGRRVPSARLEALRSPDVRLAGADRFEDVRLTAPVVPGHVEGTIEGADAKRDLAIAVNGRISAVTRTFRLDGATRFAAVLPDWALREGANDVTVLGVGRGGALTRLPGGR